MKYGLDNFVLESPFSLIISLLLLIGVYELGSRVSKFFSFDAILSKISIKEFIYPLIALYFLSLVYFILSLIGISNVNFFRFGACIICFLSLFPIKNSKKFFLKKILEKNITIYEYILVFSLILAYFILSSSPITSADALDYHIAVPIEILNTGKFPSDWVWFHSKQAGAGELLIALGLSVGAEQFGNLAQFCGIIAITGIFISFLNKRKNNLNGLIILSFLSSPIIIFLCTTPKPQLLSIAATTLAFCLTFFCVSSIQKKNYNKCIFLIFSLLFISILSKYYFSLSTFLITICLFLITRKKIFNTLLIFILSSVIILSPLMIWKYINFDFNIINSIFFALPKHLPGYDSFYESLSSCGYRCLPLWLIYPPSINEFTQTTGIVSIFMIIILLSNIQKKKIIVSLVLIYFLVGLKFGQSNPRFFLEPVIWSLLWLMNYKVKENSYNLFFIKISRPLVLVQSFLVLIILIISSFNLFPGSLNSELRKNIMINYSNGYSLFEWVHENIPENSKIISMHRSIGLSKSDAISSDFLLYTSNQNDIFKYLEILKKEKPDYLVTYGKNENLYGFEKCINSKVNEKKNVGRIATRNFYANKKYEFYNGYIYSLDYSKFPLCYKN